MLKEIIFSIALALIIGCSIGIGIFSTTSNLLGAGLCGIGTGTLTLLFSASSLEKVRKKKS